MSNDTNNNSHSNETSGFFYRKEVIRWILRIFYLCCIGLVLIDFFIHRHTEVDIEKWPAFYALYGFIACTILVFMSKAMRFFLIRDETYYDDVESPEEYLSKQGLELPTSEQPSLTDGNSNDDSSSSSNSNDPSSNGLSTTDLPTNNREKSS